MDANRNNPELPPLLLSKPDACRILGGISPRTLQRLAVPNGPIRVCRFSATRVAYLHEDIVKFVQEKIGDALSP
jgi:hypothetical protein